MIHNVCPALHGNTQEDGQHRKGNIDVGRHVTCLGGHVHDT